MKNQQEEIDRLKKQLEEAGNLILELSDLLDDASRSGWPNPIRKQGKLRLNRVVRILQAAVIPAPVEAMLERRAVAAQQEVASFLMKLSSEDFNLEATSGAQLCRSFVLNGCRQKDC
ncbi:MAG: hypothetical protein WCO60_07010 [Verrucomicrobiota bacterium]